VTSGQSCEATTYFHPEFQEINHHALQLPTPNLQELHSRAGMQ
jgi:hypothetical protein